MSNLNDLPNGFYWISSNENPGERSLVRLYTNPDTAQKGVGFGIWDGCAFVPLQDLTDDTILALALPANYESAGARSPASNAPRSRLAMPGRQMICGAARSRAALAQPEQQWPADGEAAELVAVFRKVASEDPGVVQIDPLWLTCAADLLERLASDNAGLAAAADSLWADNMSLLDSHHD
jgi:hypothetical protein